MSSCYLYITTHYIHPFPLLCCILIILLYHIFAYSSSCTTSPLMKLSPLLPSFTSRSMPLLLDHPYVACDKNLSILQQHLLKSLHALSLLPILNKSITGFTPFSGLPRDKDIPHMPIPVKQSVEGGNMNIQWEIVHNILCRFSISNLLSTGDFSRVCITILDTSHTKHKLR